MSIVLIVAGVFVGLLLYACVGIVVGRLVYLSIHGQHPAGESLRDWDWDDSDIPAYFAIYLWPIALIIMPVILVVAFANGWVTKDPEEARLARQAKRAPQSLQKIEKELES